MRQPRQFEQQWNIIAGWDWERIERAVAEDGTARVHRSLYEQHGARHPAEAAPEDVRRGRPAELAPEDIRQPVKQDVAPDAPAPLSPELIERELYFAAALHGHCRQRGLAMTAERDPEGVVWICVKRLEA